MTRVLDPMQTNPDIESPEVEAPPAPPATPPPGLWHTLSKREAEVARRLALGGRNIDVARELGIEKKTLDTHRGHALKKLRCRNNADLARLAIREGIITAEE